MDSITSDAVYAPLIVQVIWLILESRVRNNLMEEELESHWDVVMMKKCLDYYATLLAKMVIMEMDQYAGKIVQQENTNVGLCVQILVINAQAMFLQLLVMLWELLLKLPSVLFLDLL